MSTSSTAVCWVNINATRGFELRLDGGGGSSATRQEWHFTARSLDSQVVRLNGVELALTPSDALPEMPPTLVAASAPVAVAPLSWGMAVLA